MGRVQITIPMPSADCSPNSRAHWSKVSKAKKRSKHDTKCILIASGAPQMPVESYQLHFIFPDNRKRDYDNFTARCKAALDAVSEHVGNDDSEWDMAAPTREVRKGVSEVRVTLTYREGEKVHKKVKKELVENEPK